MEAAVKTTGVEARRMETKLVEEIKFTGKVPRAGTEPPSDAVILYHSLVRDGGLPDGYEAPFVSLYEGAVPAAARIQRRLANVDEMASALRLHKWKMEQSWQASEYKTVTDQFLLASLSAPRKFKSRLQRSQYQGRTHVKRPKTQNATAGSVVWPTCSQARPHPWDKS